MIQNPSIQSNRLKKYLCATFYSKFLSFPGQSWHTFMCHLFLQNPKLLVLLVISLCLILKISDSSLFFLLSLVLFFLFLTSGVDWNKEQSRRMARNGSESERSNDQHTTLLGKVFSWWSLSFQSYFLNGYWGWILPVLIWLKMSFTKIDFKK